MEILTPARTETKTPPIGVIPGKRYQVPEGKIPMGVQPGPHPVTEKIVQQQVVEQESRKLLNLSLFEDFVDQDKITSETKHLGAKATLLKLHDAQIFTFGDLRQCRVNLQEILHHLVFARLMYLEEKQAGGTEEPQAPKELETEPQAPAEPVVQTPKEPEPEPQTPEESESDDSIQLTENNESK